MLVLLMLSGHSRKKKRALDSLSSSDGNSSRISTHSVENILDKLINQQNRASTAKNYFSVWRQFNKFLIKLDVMPKLWEDRTSLFMAYLIDKGMQSSTIKSYVSAIKRTLINDKYKWKDELILLTSLTKACKLVNDRVRTRLPIYCSLLEMILFEIGRIYGEQPYLQCMYKALFALGYYGLLRVGELTSSPHTIKARDVHLGLNKDKMLVVLYSSKPHNIGDRPQKVKITANSVEKSGHYVHRNFCPFKLMREYLQI